MILKVAMIGLADKGEGDLNEEWPDEKSDVKKNLRSIARESANKAGPRL